MVVFLSLQRRIEVKIRTNRVWGLCAIWAQLGETSVLAMKRSHFHPAVCDEDHSLRCSEGTTRDLHLYSLIRTWII